MPMIPVLSLVVAILAVFIGPLVTWAVTRQQIAVTARETWMREFREKVAVFLSSSAAFRVHVKHHTTGDPEKEKRLAEINDAGTPSYHTICLLVAEKGSQYAAFVQIMDRLGAAAPEKAAFHVREVGAAAEDILRRERAAIAADPGVWGGLATSLGFGRFRLPTPAVTRGES